MREKMWLVDKTTLIIGSLNHSTSSLLDSRERSLQLDIRSVGPVLNAVESTFEQWLPRGTIRAVARGSGLLSVGGVSPISACDTGSSLLSLSPNMFRVSDRYLTCHRR